ncbi:MAG: hypothetical protein EZS28_031306 [Streblomastix strix]|uniref:Uncharacterized protein n=1 Tax=Streblomastix strix TaxID=222440 RepID=A0A5J4URT1_9EUKA|nr:MAG: hypothetical protein EZS28_031306 [Streblomastix strix]
MRSTSSTAFTTHGDTSSRSTTPAATSNDRRARLRYLIASAVVSGACLQAGRMLKHGEDKTFFWGQRPLI